MAINLINKIKNYRWLYFFALGIMSVLSIDWFLEKTSTNQFCEYCHVHPQAAQSWRLSTHFDNKSGVIVNCVDCHLPPSGFAYLQAKTVTGLRDVYGLLFKNAEEFNWELKSSREVAAKHVYKSACLYCHQNLFPRTLSKKGEDAHLYYDQKADMLLCINCHLEVGHYHEKKPEAMEVLTVTKQKPIYLHPAKADSFLNFTESIPGTTVDFEMIAIPSGTFIMGSPESESFRKPDEGPQRTVNVRSFWMGRREVSWEEYDAFYKETGGEARGRNLASVQKADARVDAITGPTPAYGNPDQGWGKGQRPAITMTHFAARRYCEWLSQKTKKTYRLPTEAEWEYACRANQPGVYFFEGTPGQFSEFPLLNRMFGADTATINSHVIYIGNSFGKTYPSTQVKANPFGLLNTLGNVKEFCLDYYNPKTFSTYPENEIIDNPRGPSSGEEFVVRGGSFKSDASLTRITARDHTDHKAWLVTDPQMPKSRWWYSDCNDVGFRVVCEYRRQD